VEYDKRQTFEHDLINRKITWLLSSQTILFAALAIVVSGDSKLEESDIESFLWVLSMLGICLSLLIFLGVCMAVRAKYLNYKKESDKQEKTRNEQKSAIKKGALRIQGGKIIIKEGLLEIQEAELSIHEADHTSNFESDPLQWGVRTWTTRFALLPDLLMPLVFATAWILVLSIFN
jgi:hypothetical protein